MPDRSIAQTLDAHSERDLGVAGPPREISSAPPVIRTAEVVSPVNPWWSLHWAQGWLGSLFVHMLLLIVLAGWYFAPRVVNSVEFNSELAGSPNGHPDGDQADGGSNGTPISLAGELGALDDLTKLEQPDQTAPLLVEAPQVNLTPLSAEAEESAPVSASRENRRGRARQIGIGDRGNWGAGSGEGFGLARFGSGGEVIRGVAVKVGDPQFTLIWDTKGVDIDLHVIEPGGDRIYFGHRNGKQGGELDVDNTWAYGPENIYWLLPSREQEKRCWALARLENTSGACTIMRLTALIDPGCTGRCGSSTMARRRSPTAGSPSPGSGARCML